MNKIKKLNNFNITYCMICSLVLLNHFVNLHLNKIQAYFFFQFKLNERIDKLSIFIFSYKNKEKLSTLYFIFPYKIQRKAFGPYTSFPKK